MKKIFSLLLVALLTFGATSIVYAEEGNDSTEVSESVEEEVKAVSKTEKLDQDEVELDKIAAEPGFTEEIKNKFIEGDVFFMSIVLACLILGLAVAIERIIYLGLVTINVSKFVEDAEASLKSGGPEAAMQLSKDTPGPIGSIYYQGFSRINENIETIEKSVVSYGSVQMGSLEKGVSWISLFIAVAPMLGFMGTVMGMIWAFDVIESEGAKPQLVAGSIKVALLTTLAGLIVAIILQFCYNYIVSKIDKLVNQMEDSSVSLIDMISDYKQSKS